MPIQLNHTIAGSRDAVAGARFLTEMLGLPEATRFGHFQVVEISNGVSIDFMDYGPDADIPGLHYAFLVTEREFDEIWGRIKERGLDFWADPRGERKGEINHNDGGRGLYWQHPDAIGSRSSRARTAAARSSLPPATRSCSRPCADNRSTLARRAPF